MAEFRKKQEIEQGMRSAGGRETSQILMIKMGNLEKADEWEDKQEKMLKQKVVPVLLFTLLILSKIWR